jgi:outer membrane protein assembly factor BamA
VLLSAAWTQADPSTAIGETPDKEHGSTWSSVPDDFVSDAPLSPRYALERIEIQGNSKMLDQTVRRYIDLELGEVFGADDTRLEAARYRLLATGFFHEVQLSLARGSRHGWVVLVVKVKERNTLVIQDVAFGLSEITPYGFLDLGERSFIGSAMQVHAAAIAAKDQYGYRLGFSDEHFLGSELGLHVQGLFTHARDYFGNKDICVDSCIGRYGQPKYSDFAQMSYDRAGLRLGTGYVYRGRFYTTLDYRIEQYQASFPAAASHVTFGERNPVVFGHMLPGTSFLSGIAFQVVRDTRDSPWLPGSGRKTALDVLLATRIIGSDYEYAKFTLVHDEYFSLPRMQSLRLGLFGGLILGTAPFIDQFFAGDFSAFVPSRILQMNFTHLRPNVLETAIQEMRYEDIAAAVNLEYSIPLYRGGGPIYGVDAFLGAGLFLIASGNHLRVESQEYKGIRAVPMDFTADLGLRIDTGVGLFVVSLANLFRFLPLVGDKAAEK